MELIPQPALQALFLQLPAPQICFDPLSNIQCGFELTTREAKQRPKNNHLRINLKKDTAKHYESAGFILSVRGTACSPEKNIWSISQTTLTAGNPCPFLNRKVFIETSTALDDDPDSSSLS